MGSNTIAKNLYDGTIDLYIGYQPENIEDLAVTPLFEEKFVILVPNRLFKEYFPGRSQGQLSGGPVSIGIFSELPFVAQNSDTMNGKVFQELCCQVGMEPHIVLSTQNLITLASLCIEGLGACVIPYTFLSPSQRLSGRGSTPLFSQEGLNRLSIFEVDSSGIRQNFQISVCRLRNKVLTRAGREFIHLAKEIYGDISTDRIPLQFHSGSAQ